MDKKRSENLTRALTAELCANHSGRSNGIPDCCLPVDRPCVFFRETERLPRCRYFEEGVLPEDPTLEAVYFAEREGEAAGSGLSAKGRALVIEMARRDKPCAKCGKDFVPANNRQEFCPNCRETNSREKDREWVRRKRAAKLG